MLLFGKFSFRCFAFHAITFQKHTSPFCSSYQPRCIGSLLVLQFYLMTGQEMNVEDIWRYVSDYHICHHHLSNKYSPLLLRLIFRPVHLAMPHLQQYLL